MAFELNNGQKQAIEVLKNWLTTDEKALNLDAKAGFGKEQPNSEPVLTPNGFVPMGSIRPGSQVIGSNGTPINVVSVHPQGQKDVYEVTFQDNTKVRCGLEHLWTVTYGSSNVYQTVSLRELLVYKKENPKIAIKLPRFTGIKSEGSYNNYSWQLGYAIGNGCFTASSFLISCHLKDQQIILKLFDAIATKPGIVRHTSENGVQIRYPWASLPNVFVELRNKPKSDFNVISFCTENILEFFAGYFDADGTVNSTNKAKFNCSDLKLFEKLVNIARSIGHRVSVFKCIDARKSKTGYGASIVFTDISKQVIKKPLLPKYDYHYTPSIKSIVALHYKEESTCISVDAPDHLYVTTGYKLTHNTFLLVQFIIEQLAEGQNVTVLAPTHAALGQLFMKLEVEAAEYIESFQLRFKTVASALAQFPVFDNSSTEVKFGSFGASELEGLVIVDEKSMIGASDAKTLIKISEKIIFSGDYNQLAAVKKKSSQEVLKNYTLVELTEMMRAKSVIAQVGYDSLTQAQYIPETSEDGSVIKWATLEEFQNSFIEKVKTEPVGTCAYITYTNAEVQEMNLRAHLAITGRITLAVGDYIRLYSSSKLGKNNAVVKVASLEVSTNGNFIITSEPVDGTAYKVEVALPDQYKKIEKEIEQATEFFKINQGSELLVSRLKELRSIVKIDYPYAFTVNKSQGASIPFVYANTQKLNGRKAFYVAYSRASIQLNVVTKIGKTKGVAVIGNTWVHKSGAKLNSTDILNAANVAKEIQAQFPELPVPSASHLQCVTNRFHASKSARGWTLV